MRFFALLLSTMLSTTAFAQADTNPSADGYKLPKLETTANYQRGGFSFDRLSRSYLIQAPLSVSEFAPVDIGIEGKKTALPVPVAVKAPKQDNAPKAIDGKYPVIILLHAGGQSAEDVWNQTTLPLFAKTNNYFLVAPQAIGKQWNDGNKIPLPGEKISYVDDVGFVMVLIENLTEQYPIDPQRVFVVGVSNGGFMATHLACRTHDLIRGGANMLSTLSYRDSQSCMARSIPWLSINSGDDKVVPFFGTVNQQNSKKELLMSAEETFTFMSNKNGCMKEGPYSQLPHFNSDDKTIAYIKVASNCARNTKNVLLSFKNAGHQLPNTHNNKFGTPFEGLSNRDIDPGTAIINFFNNNLSPIN